MDQDKLDKLESFIAVWLGPMPVRFATAPIPASGSDRGSLRYARVHRPMSSTPATPARHHDGYQPAHAGHDAVSV